MSGIVSKQDANQVLKLAFDDVSKSLRITGSAVPGSMTVDQADGTKLHVTVDATVLPAGAATSANQTSEISHLTNIETAVQTTASSGATSANQSTANASLATIATNTAGKATETTLGVFSSKTASGMVVEKFDNFAVTYVGTTSNINVVTYKLGGTTVAILTMSYDGQGRLSGAVKS